MKQGILGIGVASRLATRDHYSRKNTKKKKFIKLPTI